MAALLLWPVADDRVQAAEPDQAAECPHASTPPTQRTRTQARKAILCLINQLRAKHNLRPFTEHKALRTAAQNHAEDMGRRRYFSHRSPDGLSPHQRIRRAGFRGTTTGENLYWGSGIYATPEEAVDAWMQSPPHRANILRRTFTKIGIGVGERAPARSSITPVGVYVTTFGG